MENKTTEKKGLFEKGKDFYKQHSGEIKVGLCMIALGSLALMASKKEVEKSNKDLSEVKKVLISMYYDTDDEEEINTEEETEETESNIGDDIITNLESLNNLEEEA